MAIEAAITRTQIIVVGAVGKNSYGDLTFTDKEGGDYKISAKRIQYFEKVIVYGMAVQLNYAMSSFNKEYIYSAVLVKDKLPDKPLQSLQSISSPVKEVASSKPLPLSKDEQIERAVWVKELGEGLRSGYIPKDSPESLFYRKEMNRVLEIKSKEVSVVKKSRLLEEARRLGGVDIEGDSQ